MTEITVKNSIYDLLDSGIRHPYRYESKQFISFLKANDYGFELEALQAWKDFCIVKGYKARTVNRKLMVGKMLYRHVLESTGDDLPHHKREADRQGDR
jgi:hypothetical protein